MGAREGQTEEHFAEPGRQELLPVSWIERPGFPIEELSIVRRAIVSSIQSPINFVPRISLYNP